MRFLISEQAYEHRLASGKLRYLRHDRPTGAVEHWRLTAARQGFTFLRVDLDAREGESKVSYLYHLVLDPGQKPLRLTYQVIDATGAFVKGNVIFESGRLLHSRSVAGEPYDEQHPFGSEDLFLFPCAAGLALLSTAYDDEQVGRPGIRLDMAWDPVEKRMPGAVPVTFEIDRLRHMLPLEIGGRKHVGAATAVRWGSARRIIYTDTHDAPLALKRKDGLTAAAVQYERYAGART